MTEDEKKDFECIVGDMAAAMEALIDGKILFRAKETLILNASEAPTLIERNDNERLLKRIRLFRDIQEAKRDIRSYEKAVQDDHSRGKEILYKGEASLCFPLEQKK